MSARRGGRPPTPPPALRRMLGLREAVALGIGGTVGGGVFVLVGATAGTAGPAALLAYLLAFVASLAIALPYAELACRLPLAGGGYAFVRAVLGPGWGFLMGWGYWGAYVLLSGYVTLGFGGYLSAATGLPAPLGAVALVTACTALNLLGVKVSGRAQILVVLIALGGLAGFAAWGLPGLDPTRLRPFAPQRRQRGAGGLAAGVPVLWRLRHGRRRRGGGTTPRAQSPPRHPADPGRRARAVPDGHPGRRRHPAGRATRHQQRPVGRCRPRLCRPARPPPDPGLRAVDHRRHRQRRPGGHLPHRLRHGQGPLPAHPPGGGVGPHRHPRGRGGGQRPAHGDHGRPRHGHRLRRRRRVPVRAALRPAAGRSCGIAAPLPG